MVPKQLHKNWQEIELKKICDIKKGNSITKTKINNGNIPVIAGGQQPAYYHNISNRTGETITVSGSGAYAGFVAYFNIPIFASDCSTIQSKGNNIYLRYVYYFLKCNQKQIYKMQKGIAQPHIYPKDLAQIKIPLPPLETQKKIVSILERAESLKQKREQANKLTDEYLKSVFSEMFLKEKGKFEEVRLGEIFEIARGGSPRPIQDYITKSEDGINWIRINDTKGDSKYIYKTEEKIKPEGLKKTRIVNEGDFILSNSMSFGRPYIMRTKGCIHDGWLVLSDKDKRTDENYLYSILSSDYVYSQFLKSVSGSTVKNLNISVVKKIKIPLPPLELQRKFASIVEHVEKLKEKQNKSKESIDEMFNSLMQKAFKGELVR